MKILKKIGFLIVILFLFSSCQQKSNSILIGAAMNSYSDKWMTYLQEEIRTYGEETAEIEIVMTDGKDDANLQNDQVETLITQGIQALIIVPVDLTIMKSILDKTEEAGIKVVVINRLPLAEDMKRVAAFVGTESTAQGVIQAQLLIDAMGDAPSGEVAIIHGIPGQDAEVFRTQGNKEILSQYPDLKIVNEPTALWDRAKAIDITESILQTNPNLKVVLGNNDEMAIGAWLAASQSGIKDEDIFIGGVDGTLDALQFVGSGLDFTVFQNPKAQGRQGAIAAYNLVKGEPVEGINSDNIIWIDSEAITPENKQDYIDFWEN